MREIFTQVIECVLIATFGSLPQPAVGGVRVGVEEELSEPIPGMVIATFRSLLPPVRAAPVFPS